MTTRAQAIQAINARWVALWTNGVAYQLTNEGFDPTGLEEWVRLTVRHFSSRQATNAKPGNRTYERPGLLFIQVFVLPNTGRQRSDELCFTASKIFETKSLAGTSLLFKNASPIEAPAEEKWFGQTIQIPFSYSERK